MTSVLFMRSNLIRTVFLVFRVYEERVWRVCPVLWQTDAQCNKLISLLLRDGNEKEVVSFSHLGRGVKGPGLS